MEMQAFEALSCGLYIVSAAAGGKDAGCVVNTVTQVTNTPNVLMVAVNKENFTAGAIRQAGAFSVAVLDETATMELIGRFGFRSSRDLDKFEGVDFALDENGMPFPVEGVNAHFACRLVSEVDAGTHALFLGEVTDCAVHSARPSMTYGYYHRVKKGLTPPKASSYMAPAASARKQWRCTLCGYIYEGDALPADFRCPICGQGAEVFEELQPAPAPAAPAGAGPAVTQWRCTLCGYIYEGETLPDGFVCPICGQGTEMFEPLAGGQPLPKAAPAAVPAAWRCTVCGYLYDGPTLPDGYRCPVCGQGAEVFEPVF